MFPLFFPNADRMARKAIRNISLKRYGKLLEIKNGIKDASSYGYRFWLADTRGLLKNTDIEKLRKMGYIISEQVDDIIKIEW